MHSLKLSTDEGRYRRNKKPCTKYWHLYLVFTPCRGEEEGLAQRCCAACLALCILRNPTNKSLVRPLGTRRNVSQKIESASGPRELLKNHVNQGMQTTASSWSPRPSSSILRASASICELRTGEASPVALVKNQHPYALQWVATSRDCWRAPKVLQYVALPDTPSSISLQTKSSRRPGVAAITHAWPSRQQPTSRNSQRRTLMHHR